MNKDSQIKLGTILFVVVLLTLLVVATNNTVNETTENQTVLNEASNDTANVTKNQSLDESTFVEEENQSLNTVEQETSSSREEDFDRIIVDNEDKFNVQTKDFLESVADNEQKKDFLIKYKQGFDKNKLDKFLEVKDFEILKISKFTGIIKDLEEIIDDSAVELVELDQDLILLGESIPFNIEQVSAPDAWNLSKGAGIKVAVLDTGISQHDDLSISGGWNVIDDDSDFFDINDHGTMVAGVLSALLNDEGLIGVAPNVSLYAVKVLEDASGSLSDAIAGVEWTLDNDMNVVSMSFGFDSYSQIFKEVLDEAYDSGILLVAASGNDGINQVLHPAAYDSVIAVGAVDDDNVIADFSNYGLELELVAPGVDINSTFLDNAYDTASGTSLAVPHVAGVAALVWSYNHSLSNEQVRGKLRNDALDLGSSGKDDYYGYGLVRVNLSSENYNYSELTYYYEVYNISDYGLDNESYAFWINGNGTIDDVNFSEGYYLINKTVNGSIIFQNILVNENGTMIFILYSQNTWSDDFAYDGTVSDGILWEDGSLLFKYSDSDSEADVTCYDDDYDVGTGFSYWECWSASSSALTDCRTYDGAIDDFCSSNPSSCHSWSLTDWHNIPSGNLASADNKILRIRAYYDCAGSPEIWQSSFYYYVIHRKKTGCKTTTSFWVKGDYSVDWVNIKTYYCTANEECDGAVAGSYITTDYSYDFVNGPNNPCRTSDGYSCSNDSDCLTNHSCIGGICGGSNQTVDLAIVNIIPIQVIPDVDMVKDKNGYVVVNVSNIGNLMANANVSAWFEGTRLNISTNSFSFSNDNPRQMDANSSALFVFDFRPWMSGTNKVINASVEVVS